MNKSILEQIKQSIVFIGSFRLNSKGTRDHIIFGTGVLLNIERSFHLVIAKHVILNPESKKKKVRDNLYFFVNGKTKKHPVHAIPYEYIKQKKWKWVYHVDKSVDLAITPFLLDPQNHAMKTIPVNLFLGLDEVYETNDVFYLSFQPNISRIELDKAVKPVVRKGTVSRINNSPKNCS